MKKKEVITIHKNLHSGKGSQIPDRNINLICNQVPIEKEPEKQIKKPFLRQKKQISSKQSTSKSTSKQIKQMICSVNKNQISKSKRKAQSEKRLKNLSKNQKNSPENLITATKPKSIYTKIQTKQKVKNQSNTNIEEQSQLGLTSIASSKQEQSQRLPVQRLVEQIQEQEFLNLHKLKLHLLNFIFVNRIIRDEQYDRLYDMIVAKFPDKQQLFRSILFEIVSSLDS